MRVHPFWRTLSRTNALNLHTRRCRGLHTPSPSSTDKPFDFTQTAEFVAAASTIQSIPKSTGLPEIIVTGRANVGKSTLLNAIVQRESAKLMHTSSKAGHTKSLNFFTVGSSPGNLILVDAPGYGARGRPEWGDLFDHYIQSRPQLKRVYILFNATHGLKDSDTQMLEYLSQKLVNERGEQLFTLQAVITKADNLPINRLRPMISEMQADIWKAAPLCLPPIITSAGMNPPYGVDVLRQSIADACGIVS